MRIRILRLAALVATLLAAVGLAAGTLLAEESAAGSSGESPGDASGETVLFVVAEGPVTPVMARNLEDAVEAAADSGYAALVVRVDTPGGLVTSMQDIVKTFLGSPVPVVAWVAPPGAKAASAGYVITTAAHVAAMAPGTNIGAATPVSLGGEAGEVGDKVINDAAAYAAEIARVRGRSTEFAEDATRDGRSIGAEEAAEIDVVDLLASTRDDLLDEIDGMRVEVAGDAAVTLRTANARVETYEPSFFRRAMQWLADPNLAFLFLSIAPLAILYELANPGVGGGAVVGVILIVLALFSLSVLPVNAVGVVLLLLAIALFIGEAFIPGIGVLAAGGTISLLLAGVFLFDEPTGVGVDLVVLVPTVVLAGASAAGLAVVVRRTWSRPPETSPGSLEGARGTVRKAEGHTGQVFVEGALWQARSTDSPLEEDSTVRVVGRDGLELVVEPLAPTDSITPSGSDQEGPT